MVNMNKDMVGMDADKRNTLVVILGPTGVGKTELCLRVAEHFDIPIINADSRQLFREIPVGTAAPTAEQQQRVKHYFVGTLGLDDYYSAPYRRQHDVYRLFMQRNRRYTDCG